MEGSAEYPVISGGGPSPHSIYEAKTTQDHELGAVGSMGDGRRYVYITNTSANILATGNLLVATVPVAGHIERVMTANAGAVGDKTVSVPTATTAVSLNQYAGGYFYLNKVDRPGDIYKVKGNTAVGIGATTVVTLEAPLHTAFLATAEGSLRASKFNSPETSTVLSTPVGAPNVDIPAGSVTQQWGWVQCGGPCPLVNSAAVAIGSGVAQSATAGAVVIATAASSVIGTSMQAGVAAGLDYMLTDLNITP